MYDPRMDRVMEDVENMPAERLPFKWYEFLPFAGVLARHYRVWKQKPPLEEIAKRHGNFEISDEVSRAYQPIIEGHLLNWRARSLKENFPARYYAAQFALCATPLIAGIIGSFGGN